MSIQNQLCICPCHNTTGDMAWCIMCQTNHNNSYYQSFPEYTLNVHTDNEANIFAVLQTIRELLTDIKKSVKEISDGQRRRRAKSRKTSR